MTPLLEARNITKIYDRRYILDQAAFVLFEGESISIQARSGEGKSTLLHILSGIDTPTSGELFFHGKRFDTTSSHALRNQYFGFVFQSFHLLYQRSCLDNILLPVTIARWPNIYTKKEWKEKAVALLHRVGLQGKEEQMVHTLSGGEKQRIAIARALILDPKLLFLDEPTGNLDVITSEEILDLIVSLHKEKTISSLIIVTHEEQIAKKMQKKCFLKEKKVCFY